MCDLLYRLTHLFRCPFYDAFSLGYFLRYVRYLAGVTSMLQS